MKKLYLCNWGGVGSKSMANFFGRDYFKLTNNLHHNNVVWHTHYYKLPTLQPGYDGVQNEFDPIINEDTKVVYLYGNPYNALLSYYRRSHVSDRTWIQRHCKDLGGQSEKINPAWSIEDYLDNGEDLLGLESHIDEWLNTTVNYDILFVEFEEMWNNLEGIFNFLDVDQMYINQFPPMRKRSSDWTIQPQHIKDKLESVYGKLNNKIKQIGTTIKEANS